jgi:hypothetical protein
MLAALPPLRRRLGVVALVLVGGAAAVALERARWIGELRTAGEPERVWIWAAGDPRDARPTAFYARSDFRLTALPGVAVLTLIGDAEYIASLNGHRIGSNRYRAGAPLDRYDVAGLLVTGRNRLLVELRSPTGAGGLTARLEDGAGEVLAATGPDWAIHREFHRSLLAGGRAPDGERPVVLGRAPLGRWGKLTVGPPRPLFESLLAVDAVVRATGVRAGRTGPWDRPSPRVARGPSLGPLVQFDFGGPVYGYLQLTLRGREADAGLLRFALDATDAGLPGTELAVAAREAGVWQDSLPRRFRQVEVAGLEGVTSAGLLPLAERAAGLVDGDPGRQPSLFGVESPPLRAPAQDVIRRELESAAELGVGKDR